MDKTYNISVNNITKGAAIKISNVTYRILSLAKDGTAEIFPIDWPSGTSGNVLPRWTGWDKMQNLSPIYRASNNNYYYCKALPFSTTIGPSWELELDTHVPFSSYLQTAGSVQQAWTPWQAKNVDTGTTVTITNLTGTIPNRQTYYKTSKTVTQSSGTFHWRLLSLEDIINYFDSYTITATQLSEFLNNSNKTFQLAELGVMSYLSSNTDWYCLTIDKGYYGISSNPASSAPAPNATPVYKLNLTEYRNWTIA